MDYLKKNCLFIRVCMRSYIYGREMKSDSKVFRLFNPSRMIFPSFLTKSRKNIIMHPRYC